MAKNHRATVIVPTPQGILLAETRAGLLLLPGGKIERGEVPIAAAARELFEETCLQACALTFLLEVESPHYIHQVFTVSAFTGTARPRSDAVALHYLTKDDLLQERFPTRLSTTAVKLLKFFGDLKWK
ncbi:NUDIX domain-containing protein [Diaphorobacter caeni]|uniref:NUDIX domain-containing protein n=1 Tax=Diaphorobacter caeni TaxID=2784387 RepID=UPI00188F650F|nr:NUDIX domain-containing protein [Diaphorobacter caeni]MBF5007245.1 NUDIX domain-containing protein [Diaphorobacter caeni]